MAEENESPTDRRNPALTDNPDIVDAEVVETTEVIDDTGPPSPPPEPHDPEAFRQYQQFLEFQKFQEWQRHGGTVEPTSAPPAAPVAPDPPGKTPWWKHILRLLRFKFVRRVLYALLVLLLVSMAIDHYFGDSDDNADHGGTPGNQNPGQSPVLSTAPKEAVITLYDLVATKPTSVCNLFDQQGRSRFAKDFDAPTCAAAAQKLHAQVTNATLYKNPKFNESAVRIKGPDAAVYSCQMTVEGGPRLGAFGLRQDPKGGWIINEHDNEPADCVTG